MADIKIVDVTDSASLADFFEGISDAPRSAKDYGTYAEDAVQGRIDYWKNLHPGEWWKHPSDGGPGAACFVIANLDHALFHIQELRRRMRREELTASSETPQSPRPSSPSRAES